MSPPPVPAPGDADKQTRVRALGRLVRRYAWCRLPPLWFYSDAPDYLLVIELPDGRRFWRCLSHPTHTPEDILLGWSACPVRRWQRQFSAGGKGSHLWNEFFDFWAESARTVFPR